MAPGPCRAGHRSASAAASAPPTAPASGWLPAWSPPLQAALQRSGRMMTEGLTTADIESMEQRCCYRYDRRKNRLVRVLRIRPTCTRFLWRLGPAAGPLCAGPVGPTALQSPVLRLQVRNPLPQDTSLRKTLRHALPAQQSWNRDQTQHSLVMLSWHQQRHRPVMLS